MRQHCRMGGTQPSVQLAWAWVVWLCMVGVSPSLLWGAEAGKTPTGASTRQEEFHLTVHDQLISLRAQDTSLKAILHAIGREMKIDVEARISENEKRTVAFDKLPLIEALKRLQANYVQLVETKQREQKVTKIIVLPQGADVVHARPVSSAREEAPSKESSRPAPFRFEFDPSQHEKKSQ